MLYRLRHNLVDINKDLSPQFHKVSKDQIEMFKNALKTKKIKGNVRMCIRWFRDNLQIELNKS